MNILSMMVNDFYKNGESQVIGYNIVPDSKETFNMQF